MGTTIATTNIAAMTPAIILFTFGLNFIIDFLPLYSSILQDDTIDHPGSLALCHASDFYVRYYSMIFNQIIQVKFL